MPAEQAPGQCRRREPGGRRPAARWRRARSCRSTTTAVPATTLPAPPASAATRRDDAVHGVRVGVPEHAAGQHDQPGRPRAGPARAVRRLGPQVPAQRDRRRRLPQRQRVVARHRQPLGRRRRPQGVDAPRDPQVALDRPAAGRHPDRLPAQRRLLGVGIGHAVDVRGRPAHVQDDDRTPRSGASTRASTVTPSRTASGVTARTQDRSRGSVDSRSPPITCSRKTVRMAARADSGASRPMSGSTLSASCTGSPPAAQHGRHLVAHRGVAGEHDRDGPVRTGQRRRVGPQHARPRRRPCRRPAGRRPAPRRAARPAPRSSSTPGGDVHDPRTGRERRPVAGLGADQLLVADDGQPEPAAGAGAGDHRHVREVRGRGEDAGDDVVQRGRGLRRGQQLRRSARSTSAALVNVEPMSTQASRHARTRPASAAPGGEGLQPERLHRAERPGAPHARARRHASPPTRASRR